MPPQPKWPKKTDMKKFKQIAEQHREKGRFKPTIPRMVSSTPVVSPRPTSDSADVRLKEYLQQQDPEDLRGTSSGAITLLDKPNKEPMRKYKEMKINELSNELLHRYKEKAAIDASKADREGNFERGNKRFSGVVKSTNKQFANFKKKGFKEESEVNEAKDDEREYDYEGEMVKSDLRSIIANANRLIDMLEDDDNLPEWCQNKVTLAEDYISTVANYMTAEMNEQVEQIDEGRPSQRHPLEGHEYHKKSDEALIHIAKDAHKAAEAMKGHNTQAENKYRDQANDSATIRHFRKTSGMPNWYKKKYGHMKEEVEQIDEKNEPTNPALWSRAKALARSKFDVYPSAYANGWASKWYKSKGGGWRSVSEEVEQIDELSKTTLASYATKAADQARNKKDAAIGYVRQRKGMVSTGEIQKSAKADKRIEGVKGAIKRLAKEEKEPPFEPTKEKQKVIPGKFGKGYSTARHLARMAMQKQSEKMKKAPIKEESKKAKIVKDVMKKKTSEDAFQKDPEMSNTLSKNV